MSDDAVSIVKACSAVKGNDDKASDRLDEVAAEARGDLGYVLCRVQWLMRKDKIADASREILAARSETMALQDADEWWRVRRALARKLLDQSEYQSAYDVVRGAALPASETYRAEAKFLPGWIALRFLDDAKTALTYFARIDDGSANPITLARASYWRGRATEALGETDTAHAHYEAAARHTTAYYGQLARAKLGLDQMVLRAPPQGDSATGGRLKDEIVRAAELLYEIREREAVVAFVPILVWKVLTWRRFRRSRKPPVATMTRAGCSSSAGRPSPAGLPSTITPFRPSASPSTTSSGPHRGQHHLFGRPLIHRRKRGPSGGTKGDALHGQSMRVNAAHRLT